MKLLKKFRNNYFVKGLSMTIAISMAGEIFWPTMSLALTSGPSQPEVQSFEPVETTDMVNLFTGDFTYNIPLMYLPGPNGGYPINLAYHGGVTMDEEASWVGLGWNINAGALVRNVRGFADDSDGDILHTKIDMKPNVTVGVGVGANIEIIGADPAEGSAAAPSPPENTYSDPLSLELSLGIRYNNYKGFGYSAGIAVTPPDNSTTDWSFGLSLDSEAGVGANVSVTMDSKKNQNVKKSYGISFDKEGLGFNFSRSKYLGTAQHEEALALDINPNDNGIDMIHLDLKESAVKSNGSSGIGYSANTHMPVINYPITNNHVNIKIKTGASLATIFGNLSYSGYFNTQYISGDARGVDVEKRVYGYEHLENYDSTNLKPSQTENRVMDFSRQKDGMVSKHMPNLAAPMLTNDVYQVVGQGIAGNFRAYRTDVGRVYDPYISGTVFGGSLAFDLGAAHLGYGGTLSSGWSKNLPWDYQNDWSSMEFIEPAYYNEDTYKYKDMERFYYRMHGDKASLKTSELDFIGGEHAIKPKCDDYAPLDIEKLNKIEVQNGLINERDQSQRVARNILIHKLTNEELSLMFESYEGTLRDQKELSGVSDISEMSIFYYNWGTGSNPWSPESGTFQPWADQFLDRSDRGTGLNEGSPIGHHTGGYKILNDQGQYYVYGLPAYNNLETESVFSVDGNGTLDPTIPIVESGGEVDYKIQGTDEFIDKKTKAPYAHSYLLTSILGADYVDVDGNGPTDDDLGYWVRFDYVKYADNYKWRAPYVEASYDRGSTAHIEDDKGSYIYGEKEQWYLAKAETKTHVMVFDLSERNDMIEAAGEFSNSGYGTKSGLKIDKISLYLKEDYYNNPSTATPLQEVHFEYDYSQCQGVPNNNGNMQLNDSAIQNQGGKLTLKRVWFTYEGSGRGAMSPYEFVYDESRNYDYDLYAYDRWGGYKKDPSLTDDQNNFINRYLPYVNQFDQSLTDEQFQDKKNDVAGAWSLSQVKLPSGGTIDVSYEADDYSHIQDELVTQMFPITSVNDDVDGHVHLNHINHSNNDFNDPLSRRIYFRLENPLPVGWSSVSYAEEIYHSYVRGLVVDEAGNRNLYFKNYTLLRDNIWEFVSGYAPIEIDTTDYQDQGEYLFGVSESSGGFYKQGFLTLKKQVKKIEHDESSNEFSYSYFDKYHPMAMAAWQHMRINDPLLLSTPAGIDLESSANGSDQGKADAAVSLLGFIPQTIQMFTGIWHYCQNNQFGREIDLNRSVIRLCSPDQKKYGGGHRVKQISVSDNWDDFSGETESVYGVQYEYSTHDDQGNEISSGVAQYEPLSGGDEIALRFPKAYVNNVPFKTDNNAYFEHPVNEAYFPAPVVGYRKVTVKSINTAQQMRMPGEAPNTSGIGTTGVTVYEFYTAKDFPVVVEETSIEKAHYNVPIPIPFIGAYERKKITAIQGYKIELNDMHGQPRSIKKYGLTKDGYINNEETSSITYVYSSKTESIVSNDPAEGHKNRNRLVNEVDAIANELGIPEVQKRLVGVEYEFFTDQRHNKSHNITAGAYSNADFLAPVFLPIPGFWPAFSSSKKNMKTLVTNKIIFKSALLKDVITFDGKARVTTTNEVYDAQTGRPLIVSVNNEFEDKIYNYSHPAHWEYDQMGSAYKNIDLRFTGKILSEGTIPNQYEFDASHSVILYHLVSGDELIVTPASGGSFKATYLGKMDDYSGIIHVESVASDLVDDAILGSATCDFTVIRSGRRNHVYADAGTMVTHQFPVRKNGYIPSYDSTTVNVNETIGTEVFTYNNYKIYRIDSVLNSSVVLFRDEWSVENPNIANPYATGEAGIWRPYRSYVYVDDRTAGTSADNRDLRFAGMMHDVVLFNWQTPDFEKFVENWEWTKEISRYNSEAYELENIDRLGIKSAALYCIKGSQVLAVGANAGYHELGVEDFEDYSNDGTYLNHQMENEGNLNFYNLATTTPDAKPIIRHYKIEKGKSLTNGNFIIAVNTSESIDFNHQAKLDVQASAFTTSSDYTKQFGRSFHIPCTVTDTTYSAGQLLIELTSDIQFNTSYLSFIQENSMLSGRISFIVDSGRNPAAEGSFSTSQIVFTNQKAHTGKMSMRMDGGANTFPQSKLDLESGKTYVLSAWVSLADAQKISFDDVEILPMEYDGAVWNSCLVMGSYTRGKVVEGWQKIEMEFVSTGGQIFGIKINNVTSPSENIFIDDIRVAPKTGGIVTYVYDNHNLRLKAMLDNNNYASFYYYDEQGNLYLVKRETERGIQTVTENHGHNRISSNP